MKINRDALKARVKKYAPAVIAVVSTATAIAAVLYYRNRLEQCEEALLAKRYGFEDNELRIVVHPDQINDVVHNGAVLQYWIEADGEENLVTTKILPIEANVDNREPTPEVQEDLEDA